jgi:hypothetical protein
VLAFEDDDPERFTVLVVESAESEQQARIQIRPSRVGELRDGNLVGACDGRGRLGARGGLPA